MVSSACEKAKVAYEKVKEEHRILDDDLQKFRHQLDTVMREVADVDKADLKL